MNNNPLGRKFKLGLIVNPFAGIGGALALKGSDGPEIREKALSLGAQQLAMHKTHIALQQCVNVANKFDIYTGNGDMGANVAQELSFNTIILHHSKCNNENGTQSEIEDTLTLAQKLLDAKVDLILFAGGDGTARNICSIIHNKIPVLGVPAGCKIHSGVYAITPKAAGSVLLQVIQGELVSLYNAEVRDIDEEKFRAGTVVAKYFGEMQVPAELRYIQAVKMGGKESDELILDDISDYVIEIMEDFPNTNFVMGSGSTVAAIMQRAGLNNTLLGVDVVRNLELIASDVNAQELLEVCAAYPTKLVATAIGGQGHILGRGNQQLSVEFIRRIGKQNIILVASKKKLQALGEKGLISDSGDEKLDKELAGSIPVITGYRDQVLYFVRG